MTIDFGPSTIHNDLLSVAVNGRVVEYLPKRDYEEIVEAGGLEAVISDYSKTYNDEGASIWSSYQKFMDGEI